MRAAAINGDVDQLALSQRGSGAAGMGNGTPRTLTAVAWDRVAPQLARLGNVDYQRPQKPPRHEEEPHKKKRREFPLFSQNTHSSAKNAGEWGMPPRAGGRQESRATQGESKSTAADKNVRATRLE
jgi:hypothetical protein